MGGDAAQFVLLPAGGHGATLDRFMTALKPLRIAVADLAAIRASAAAAHPREACGLLVGGADGRVNRVEPADNVAAEPERRFSIDPITLFRLHKALRGTADALIGHWHSHPRGEAVPSACDREMVSDMEMAWLILDSRGVARAWRPAADGFVEIPLMEIP